jgi:DICT domain-containing protein
MGHVSVPSAGSDQLTIAQLAEMTGVAQGTLRMWELRHRFPTPARRPNGRRRYSQRDVQLVRAVLADRERGLSLPAAIGNARLSQRARPVSIFAGLRERRAELRTFRATKPMLMALTRALEDDYCARGAPGILIGSFQRERFYRQSERRWHELARTSATAVVLADFPATRSPRGAPHEVHLDPASPQIREWSIVCSAPGAWACLAACELPSARVLPDAQRCFETLFSPEPEVVAQAVSVAAAICEQASPGLSSSLVSGADGSVLLSAAPELRSSAALTQRMLAYVSETGAGGAG